MENRPNISLQDHFKIVDSLNQCLDILRLHRMPTRTEALTITKIEEAIMWLENGAAGGK